jgi:IS605 OrfB family transposase
MKLTIQLKLKPTPEQADALKRTLEAANAACDYISQVAWETQTFRQFAIHKLTYQAVRETFHLAAQLTVRCIAKVADAYKLDRKTQRTFQPHGAVAYDDRILSLALPDSLVSIRKLAGQERRFAKHVNHCLSRRIVAKAECTKRAIAMEELTHIRTRMKARRSQRATLHSWAFAQLRSFIAYKAQLRGVPVHFVDPRNTSRTCPAWGYCAKENRRRRRLLSAHPAGSLAQQM